MDTFKRLLWIGMIFGLCGCSSTFKVQTDPPQAEVFFKNPESGEKKSIGKTPLELPMSEVRTLVGDAVLANQYFPILIEKEGFDTETVSIPVTSFGTMVTELSVKLKSGGKAEEVKSAKDIVDRLFLAQRFALTNQYERAQIEIDKILKTYPAFPRALSMRASIYFAQKNYDESLKWYEEAIKADPQMEEAVKMAAKVRALTGRGPASPGGTQRR